MLLIVTIFIPMMKDSFLNKRFRYTFSNACVYLVLINVLVFLAVNYTNISFRGIPLAFWLGLVPGFINRGWVWQFVTYLFVHGSYMHLFFNMLALLMFGRVIERMIGTREFLLFYFLCGILGGVISYVFYLIQGAQYILVMGASGSIYALLFLSAVLFPSSRILLFIIPMKMPYAVLLYIAIEVFSLVYGLNEGTAHLIHLSCIVIAWIYVAVRFRLNPIKVWKENL